MSQHSSLKSSKARKKHRTVLKRYEKFFALKEKGKVEDDDSVFGLPKLKIVRVKIKKEKAEEKPEAAEGAAAATPEAAEKETASKPAAKAKEEKKK